MKKIILGAAVAFAAIFGGYTASQTSEMASLDLMNANDIEAEAAPGDYKPFEKFTVGSGETGVIKEGNSTTSTYTYTKLAEANAGGSWWVGMRRSKTITIEGRQTTTYYYCDNSNSNPCQSYYTVVTEEYERN